MRGLNFQIAKMPRRLFTSLPNTSLPSNSASVLKIEETSERIDVLLENFDKSIEEMKRFIEESGYSRRHFFSSDNFLKLPDNFSKDSHCLKEKVLSRACELSEWELCRSILNLGSIYRWKEAEAIFFRAKLKFPFSSNIYSAMIYAYGKVGNYSSALNLFEEAAGKPSSPLNRKSFDALLEAYSVHVERKILAANSLDAETLESSDSIYRQAHSDRALNEISMDPALQIYRQMLHLKFTPTIATITRIIRLAGRLKRFSVIEDMQRECERLSLKFDARAYEVLIFAQMQCGRSDEAEESLKRALQTFGFAFEGISRLLNVMLFGYCRLRRPLEANRVLKQFSTQGVEPSPSALSFLVGTAAKCGFIRDAEDFYRKLSASEGSKPFLVPAANHLLAAYLRDNNFQVFYQLIDELNYSHRDQYSNTLLFEALSRSIDHKRLSKEITKIKIKMNRENLSSMELSALFRCLFINFEGDYQLIKEFVDHVKFQIRENENNFNGTTQKNQKDQKELRIILLDVFSKLKEWNSCVELVDLLLKSNNEDINSVDPMIFAKLMTAAGANFEKINFVLNWMDRIKCWRDPAILTAAMEYFWKADCVKEARALWDEIRGRRNKARSFSVAISVMSQILLKEEGPAAALQHLNSYRSLWNDSAVQIYLKSLRLFGATSSQEIEQFFFEKLVKMNPPPSIEVCNEVLIFLLNKKESLERIVDWMCKSGCHPNVQTMNILLSASEFKSKPFLLQIGEKLLENMIEAGGRPSHELLLRMISGQLEKSMEVGDLNHQTAEKYSKLFIDRTDSNIIRLSLFEIWMKYFVKHNRIEKIAILKEEIKNLNSS